MCTIGAHWHDTKSLKFDSGKTEKNEIIKQEKINNREN